MMFSVDVRCVIAIQCLFVFLMASSVQAQPQLERGPQNAVVRQGDPVEFVCDLTDDRGYTIYWHYQGQRDPSRFLSFDREIDSRVPLQLQQRLSIIGNDSQVEFTLRITNVQKDDEGTYSCRYGYTGVVPTTVGTAELTVLVPPSLQSPWCGVVPISGAVGDYVDLDCNSRGGDPSPNISYYRENKLVAGPATNSIRHRYQLNEEDNGVTFTCIMTTHALDEQRNCSVVPLRIIPSATILPAVSTVEVPEPLQTTVTRGLTVTQGLTETEGLTVAGGLTAKPGETSLLPIVPIAVVVAVLVIITVVVLAIFVWRKKQQEKSKIPIDSKDELRMRDIEGEYDDLTPRQDGRTVIAGLPRDDQDTTNGKDVFPGGASHSKSNTRADSNGKDLRSIVETPTAVHQDVPLYAQPDKPKNARKTEDVTSSEYSTVPVEEPEPVAADFGLVYADLDLQTPGAASVDMGQASSSEKTVYAMIRT